MAFTVVEEEGGSVRATFTVAGEQYEMDSLWSSEEEPELISRVLAAAAGQQAQGALDTVSISELVESLQACVHRRNEAVNEYEFDTAEDVPPPTWSLLFAAARLGSPGSLAARQLLLLDPGAADDSDQNWGCRPLAHEAAAASNAAVFRLLLEAAPAPAARVCPHQDGNGWEHVNWTLLHSAAEGGSVAAIQLVLAANPGSAHAVTNRGTSALHVAARFAEPEAVQLLLEAAPDMVRSADEAGWLPLHETAEHDTPGHAAVIALLLTAAPDTKTAKTAEEQYNALHLAAVAGCADSVRLLLKAAPQAARQLDSRQHTPLHRSADWGILGITQLLLQAAPQAAQVADEDDKTPFGLALGHLYIKTARCLVPHTPAVVALGCIEAADLRAHPLFADCIIAHAPLSPEQWAQVPAACPELGRTLPAALACSEDQARQLVRRLPLADAARLRASLLVLSHEQRRLHIFLPPDVSRLLLSMCFA